VPLAPKEFDAMIRTALRIQASRIACEALRIGPEEAHARFGLPA
jgi:hypothetical protein